MPGPDAKKFTDDVEIIHGTPDVLPFKTKDEVVVADTEAIEVDTHGLLQALQEATDAGDVDEEALKLDQAA